MKLNPLHPRPREMRETCAVCGRTGMGGFITRKGLRVCQAVPGCMERTLGVKPLPMPTKGLWDLTDEARRRIINGQLDFRQLDTFRVQLLWDGKEIPSGGGYTRGGMPVDFVVIGASSVHDTLRHALSLIKGQVSFATNPVWTATRPGFSANGAQLLDADDVLCRAGIGDLTVTHGCTLTISSELDSPFLRMLL